MTKILNRAAVLVVCLRKEQEPVLDFLVGSPEGKRAGAARWREGVSPDEFCREAKNTPTVVLVTGYGVIAKAYADGSELAAKVTKSGEFVWACELQADGTRRLAFVRRGQLDGLFRLLDEKRIPVAEVRMDAEAANAAMKETAAWQALRLYGETLSLKRVLCGDRLAAAAAGRLRLPLLLALLLLLGVNYPVSLSLQKNITGNKMSSYVSNGQWPTSGFGLKKRNACFRNLEIQVRRNFARWPTGSPRWCRKRW